MSAGHYAAMLAALYAARRFGVRFELDRMRAALERLGSPERALGAVLHVGGTNGKGSTAALAESALRAAGWRTGLYSSPHLSRFTERIQIAGAEIDAETLGGLHAVHVGVLDGYTFFEQATLLAMLAFAEARVDVTILEVGLGGRLDATNVVDAEVAVVTGVALDHEEHLGRELSAIAGEKAGIWKRGRAAVIGAGGEPEAVPVLEAAARAAGVARLVLAPPSPPAGVVVPLRGAHQLANAATAWAALDELELATGGRIAAPPADRITGFAAVRWPGRCEEVAVAPRIWLDAAHNPHGARALAATLAAAMELRPGRIHAVVGVSSDKDVPALVAPIAALASLLVATEAPSPRALPAAELARVAAGLPGLGARQVIAEPDPQRALAVALAGAAPEDLVVVCGSIFLIGPIRARLRGEPEDPVAAQDPVR